MHDIERIDFRTRIHLAVVHGGIVYLTGQVGTRGQSAAEQTREVLAKIDALLAQAGSDKTRILQATLWLSDMADVPVVNAVWDAWMPNEHAPARSTGQVQLASSELLVEITVIAAIAKPTTAA